MVKLPHFFAHLSPHWRALAIGILFLGIAAWSAPAPAAQADIRAAKADLVSLDRAHGYCGA
jgi:hypothetical protein